MNIDDLVLTEWERQALDKIERYDTIKYAKEEGIEQGSYQNKIDIARRMLKENMDISLIAKITDLPKEEILKFSSD